MNTISLSKCITDHNPQAGHVIIKASGVPAAKDKVDMTRKLNQIISAQKNDPQVLTLFIKAVPDYYTPTYNPADGGGCKDCKCGGKCGQGAGNGSHNADGEGTRDANPKSWVADHKGTLVAITAILAIAYIIK